MGPIASKRLLSSPKGRRWRSGRRWLVSLGIRKFEARSANGRRRVSVQLMCVFDFHTLRFDFGEVSGKNWDELMKK
ncbi:hypothetical protein HNY73_009247 [Argiope bruennichi]|uniref:Uncharacterized protein n=1 Tax=Argiope bruennichi TaxID=94029 RepID=A0A8T0FBE3_ARGBR|nr:hypothetical protein HNY73_009247 [Argiope bruennichi]